MTEPTYRTAAALAAADLVRNLADAIDARSGGVDHGQDIADLKAAIEALASRPPTTGGGSFPGAIPFDGFSGTNDNQRITDLNKWTLAQQKTGGPTETVVFGADREHAINVPILLRSGLKLQGALGLPPREYSRAPVIKWTGAGDLFQFPPATEGQPGQGYPSDGSPRDGTVVGIQFDGRKGTNLIQRLTSPGSQFKGKTLWYWQWHNIGVKHFDTAWWGAGTGTSFATGVSHFQGLYDTPIFYTGSENQIFGLDGASFMDTQMPEAMGKPLVRSIAEKGVIGYVMPTGRKNVTPIQLEGGRAVRCLGISPDSQGSDPIFGAGVRITGGEGHMVIGSCFKGLGVNPAAAPGGAAANRGMVHISGGSQHVVMGTDFLREGDSDFPVVAVVGSARDVKVGLNAHVGFGSSRARYVQSSEGRFASFVADSTAELVTAA